MFTFSQPPSSAVIPPPPGITPRRAYGEVIGLFLVILGFTVINSVQDGWEAMLGSPPSWLEWWNYWAVTVKRVSFLAGVLWLISLQPWKDFDAGAVATGLVAIVGFRVAAVVIAGDAPALSTSLGYLTEMALAAALAGMLARRRGLTLSGFGLGRDPDRDRVSAYAQAQQIGWWSFAGLIVSSLAVPLMYALARVPTAPGGFEVNGIHDIPNMIISSVHAGVVEELLLVATLVTALEAARRPAWQIYATGLALRVAIHLYIGVSAPAAIILAATNIWLFRRTRRLMPLVVAHALFNLAAPIQAIGGGFAPAVVLCTYLIIDAVIAYRHKAQATRQEQEQVRSS